MGSSFERDARLVFENAILYSGRESVVGGMAKSMLEALETELTLAREGRNDVPLAHHEKGGKGRCHFEDVTQRSEDRRDFPLDLEAAVSRNYKIADSVLLGSPLVTQFHAQIVESTMIPCV